MLSLFAYIKSLSDTRDTLVIDVPGRFAPNIPKPVWDVEGLFFRTSLVRPEYPSDNTVAQVKMKKDGGSGAWSLYARLSSGVGITGYISLMNFVPCGEYEEVAA